MEDGYFLLLLQFMRKLRIGKIITLVLIGLMGMSVSSYGQYYTLGADPANIQWMQLDGEHYKIIYPHQADSLARRYLYLFESTRTLNSATAHIDPDKVPIILHPYQVNSNATVVWAPKRVDVFTTPEAVPLYPQNWDRSLALHEGRHVVQMTHFTKGFYRIVHYLAGEQSVALGIGMQPTGMLFEGDAVINETELSMSGRGRSADFLMYYRSAFHDKDYRDELNWRFVSYNRYTPGKYNYGYMVTAMARYNSGNYYTSGDIMQQKRWWFWRIFDVSHWAYRYASGLTQKENWYKAVDVFDGIWEKDYRDHAPYSSFDSLLAVRHPHHYINYTSVLPTVDGQFLSTKVSLQDSRHLIKIDASGKEHYLRPFSSTTSRIVSDNRGNYYFSEIVPDIRWEIKSSSIIRRYDENRGRITDLTKKTRMFNPTLTKDGNTLVAVEYPPLTGSNTNIVFLNAATGEVKSRLGCPSGWQISEAVSRDGADDGEIFALAVIGEGIAIMRYRDGQWSNVTEVQYSSMRNLSLLDNGNLMFVSDLNGVSNVYEIDPSEETPKPVQRTSARFGTTTPTVQDGKLYYSDFDRRGYNPAVTSVDSLFSKRADFAERYIDPVADSIARQGARLGPKITAEQDSAFLAYADSLPSKRYRKIFHGIHIHSWAPVYVDINRVMNLSLEQIDRIAAPGVMVMSQNELGTLSAIAGYSYRKGLHGGHLNINYSGLFPVFEANLDFNDNYRTTTYLYDKPNPKPDEIPVSYRIDTLSSPALDFTGKAYIPFNLSRGGWNIGIIPNVEYHISNDKVSTFGKEVRNVQNLLLNLRYYQMVSEPTARLMPRAGWGVDLNYASAVGRHDALGKLFYANVYGYLPGFNDVQGWRLEWSMQRQLRDYPFAYLENLVSPVRGYDNAILTDYNKFSVDYAIPIYGKFDGFHTFFFFLQRLILVPFADVAINKSDLAINSKGEIVEKGKPMQYSFGTKFMVDLHFFRFGFGLKLGVQYARTGEDRNSFKFVMSTGL